MSDTDQPTPAPAPDRPPSLLFYLTCPLWIAAVASIPYANNFIHGLAGNTPAPISAEQLVAGEKPKSTYVAVSGRVDRYRGGTIETKSRRSRSTDRYVSLVGDDKYAPVRVLIKVSGPFNHEHLAPTTVTGVLRNVLWEGLPSAHHKLLKPYRLADKVLLLETTTPSALLRNGLIYLGIVLALLYAMMLYSYVSALRAWRKDVDGRALTPEATQPLTPAHFA